MSRFTSLIMSVLAVVVWSQVTHAGPSQVTCSDLFAGAFTVGPRASLPERAIRAFVAKKVENYRVFRTELKDQGLRRLLLAPKNPDQKMKFWDVIADPIFEPPQAALAKTLEVLGQPRPAKRLSAFFTVPMTMLIFGTSSVAVDTMQTRAQVKIVSTAAQKDQPGAVYIEQLIASDAVDLHKAADAFIDHRYSFSAYASGQEPWPRIEELKRKNMLNDEQAKALTRAVNETIRSLAPNGQMPVDFDSRFRSALLQRVEQEPELNLLPATTITSFSFIIWPQVQIEKRSDLDLYIELANSQSAIKAPKSSRDLAFAGLWEVADKHIRDFGLGAFLKWTADIDAHPERIAAKQREAVRMGFPKEKIAVASRPDLPAFSRKFEFYDLATGVHPLNSEMDRWNLVLHDWRLQSVKRDWLANQTPSLEALTETEQMVRSLDQLFRMENPSRSAIDVKHLREPTEKEILELTGADGKHTANALFAPVNTNIEQFHLKGASATYYRHYAATMYWNFFAEDSALNRNPTERQKHFERYDSAETRLLEMAISGDIVKALPAPRP